MVRIVTPKEREEENKIVEFIQSWRNTVEELYLEVTSFDRNSKTDEYIRDFTDKAAEIHYRLEIVKMPKLERLTRGDSPSQTTIDCRDITNKARIAYKELKEELKERGLA